MDKIKISKHERDALKDMKFAFVLNLFFSIVEIIGGIFTNSISIISDAIHDFGDAVAMAVSIVLEKKSRRRPNKSYTFGYLRYSVLGAFITALILLVGSILVIYNAVIRIIDPQVVNYNGMIILAIVGVVLNYIASKRTSHSNNLNEKVINLHMLEDVLGWLAVLIGALVMKIFNLPIIDPILSLCIAVFILINVFKNLRGILNIFLEKTPNGIDASLVKKTLEKDNIYNVHHVHIWTMDGISNYATLHVVLDGKVKLEEVDAIKEEIKKDLNHIGIHHCVIEAESIECKNNDCNE